MKVKLCGITNLDDALFAEKAGYDALGFIFYRKSNRCVKPEQIIEITKELNPLTIKVGVFVNEVPAIVNDIVKRCNINIAQLHGDESPEYVQQIKVPVIKAFRVNDKFNFEILNEYHNCSFLLDTYDKDSYGGIGKTFNWELIPDEIKNSIILAGGVSNENIGEIIEIVMPIAVDVSSSLEKEPGIKDHKLVTEFINKIKSITG